MDAGRHPDFLAGRVIAAIGRYRASMLPPYARALADYSHLREHRGRRPATRAAWHSPRIPAGRAFFDFYGENLFRTDMGIERGQLGSLLDHTGPVLKASDMRLACSVRTAATPVSSEPPDPTGPSCRPA